MYTHRYTDIYIYILGAHQGSCSDQMKILKAQSAKTTTRAVGIAYPLWLSFSINRVLNLTNLRSIIYVNIYVISIILAYIRYYILLIYIIGIYH